MNVIAIPFYHKAELLWITLDSLKQCPEFSDYFVLFKPDKGATEECYKVIEKHMENFSKWKISNEEEKKGAHCSNLNFPIMRAMQEASAFTSEYFLLFTEDWRVSNDYLRYQDYCYHHFFNENIWNSSGWQIKNDFSKWDDVVFSTDGFAGGCEMISKKNFDKYTNPHINDEFFRNAWDYTKKYFPESPHNRMSEIDGLEDNIQWQIQKDEKHEKRSLRPSVSRTQHTGFWQRGVCPFKGSWDERMKKILEIINSRELYLRYRDVNDWAPYRNDIVWEKLKLVREENVEEEKKWRN